MRFGKKKETAAQKKARLEKELAETTVDAEKELVPPEPPVSTPVKTMANTKKDETGQKDDLEKLVTELETKYSGVFPELGPSGHAHVERWLLLAIIGELRALREGDSEK